MNKQDIIDTMAGAANISKAAAERALNAFTDAVTSGLTQGDEVVLVGFGTWTTSQRSARTGRNPQTGAAIKIPSSTVAKFKAGKKLKDAVNKNTEAVA
ncbi:MAG: DNA-binding protein HU [Coxiella sp. RIFCSPHIGHO2_12_FULL_42_15]|nr:MAG: DNA-binding protein HU [Coxiella sp. RIFCSPHIGHO2_12_FULL_42_15]